MDIEENYNTPLIIGRPFMKMERMMIDVDEGLIKVRVQDKKVNFSLFEDIKHPITKGICFKMDASDKEKVDEAKTHDGGKDSWIISGKPP